MLLKSTAPIAMTLARKKRNHRPILLLALFTIFSILVQPEAASAQDGGIIVLNGMRPYTETMDSMVRRQKSIPRLPKALIKAPPENEREGFELPRVDPGYPEVKFPAPSFNRARILAGTTGFAGVSLVDQLSLLGTGSIPPDTCGAIGPNHFLQIINSSVAVYNRTGTRLSLVSLDTFFNIPGVFPINGTFDPRVLYDRRSGRWFACTLDFGTNFHNGKICLAVSKTNDPTGAWDKYVFLAGGPTEFADHETLGVDDNGVYFGTTGFLDAGGASPRLFVTHKASLLAASPSMGTVTKFTPASMYSTPMPAINLDAVGPTAPCWVVSSSTTVFGNVHYAKVTWSGTTPSLSATSILTTPGYGGVFNAPASGSSTPINVGDDRVMGAVIRGNRLWMSRNVGVNASGGSSSPNRTACEWIELDVSGASAALVQQGRIYDPAASSPRFYYFPSISVNGQGHATIGFSGSKSTEFVGAYFAQRLKTDPLGQMGPISVMKAGANVYTQNDNSGRNRWGDYSFTSLDPNDDMSHWTIQEYAHPTANRWGTWIMQATSPAPTLNNPNGSASQGAVGVVLNLTGTGFYDPGAGFANRLSVQLLGGATNGISNYSVTFNSATSVTVTFNVAANASAGTRDVKLTNPDGQSVTVAGGFTVTAGGGPTAVIDPNPASATVPHDGNPATKNASLTLDGSSSTDPGNLALSYVWKDANNNTVGNASSLNLSLPAGSYTYTLTVTNTNNQSDSESVPVTIHPEPNAGPSANAGSDQGASVAANGTKPTVTLNGTASSDPDGDTLAFEWKEGATVLGTTATLNVVLGAGVHTITLKVTDPYGASSSDDVVVTVTGRTTTIVTPSLTATIGTTAKPKATLKAGTTVLVGKTVEFFVNGTSIGTAVTNASGVALISYPILPPTGARTLVSKFYGDDVNAPATSGTATLTVNKGVTKVTVTKLSAKIGLKVNLKATVKAGTLPVVGQDVTFKVDGATIGTVPTNASGVASVQYKVPEPAGAVKTITAEYAGDSNFQAATGTATLTVLAASTKLTGDILTKTAGTQVSIGAKLVRTTDSAPLAGKTVNFYDSTGTTLIGSGTTDANGRAVITVTAPAVGVTVTYVVKFLGDSDYVASSGTAKLKGS